MTTETGMETKSGHSAVPVGRRQVLTLAAGALAAPWVAGEARADNTAKEIRIAFGNGLAYLPFYVGQKRNFFNDALAEAGFPDVKVSWPNIAGTSALNEAMLSGIIDCYVAGAPGVLIVWDKTRGRPNQIVGCAGVTTLPLALVTVTDRIKSLADFGPTDKIAMPSIVGTPAAVVRMACEETFGPGQFRKLDANLVSLAHPDAVNALLNKTEVTGYLSSPPFTELVTRSPGGRIVLRSPDVFKGPASFVLLCSRLQFARENPKLIAALVAGLEKSNAFIAADPKAAAEIYLEREPSKVFDQAFIEQILKNPETVYTTTPRGIMRTAEFMVRTGEIKSAPKSWKELFVPPATDLPGD